MDAADILSGGTYIQEVVIASAVRTAIGKFGGTLKDVSAQKIGALAIKEAVKRANIDGEIIDEVIMGNVISAGLGQNPARQAAIYGGIPYSAGAFTLNKVCGSGLKAIVVAAQAIKAGDANVIVAGGMENMTRAPYLLNNARFGYRLMDGKITDAMVYDGLWDVYNDFHMGHTGEVVAEKFGIAREDIDAFAYRSHSLAAKAIEEGKFKEEIVPVEIPQKKGDPIIFDTDEGVRADSSTEKLGKLRPFFKKDGVVTAGNASQISDGASATVIMSKDRASEMGIEPLATIRAYNTSGMEPEHVMSAPIPGVHKILEDTGLKISDFDYIEHNEAFASASVAVQREFGIPDEIFNVRGGAVALGHPIGCSGNRVMVTLLHTMKQNSAKRGMETVCLGGGNAVTMIVER